MSPSGRPEVPPVLLLPWRPFRLRTLPHRQILRRLRHPLVPLCRAPPGRRVIRPLRLLRPRRPHPSVRLTLEHLVCLPSPRPLLAGRALDSSVALSASQPRFAGTCSQDHQTDCQDSESGAAPRLPAAQNAGWRFQVKHGARSRCTISAAMPVEHFVRSPRLILRPRWRLGFAPAEIAGPPARAGMLRREEPGTSIGVQRCRRPISGSDLRVAERARRRRHSACRWAC